MRSRLTQPWRSSSCAGTDGASVPGWTSTCSPPTGCRWTLVLLGVARVPCQIRAREGLSEPLRRDVVSVRRRRRGRGDRGRARGDRRLDADGGEHEQRADREPRRHAGASARRARRANGASEPSPRCGRCLRRRMPVGRARLGQHRRPRSDASAGRTAAHRRALETSIAGTGDACTTSAGREGAAGLTAPVRMASRHRAARPKWRRPLRRRARTPSRARAAWLGAGSAAFLLQAGVGVSCRRSR